MMSGGADILKQFTTIGSVQPPVAGLIFVLLVVVVVAIGKIVQLRTTVRLLHERIDEIGDEKRVLQNILNKIADKNVFQSSVLHPLQKEELPNAT
jgi:hypothetical protein